MMETSIKVDVYRYEYRCDAKDCEGKMVFDGSMTGPSHATFYSHRCSNCDEWKLMPKQYPRVRYVAEDET